MALLVQTLTPHAAIDVRVQGGPLLWGAAPVKLVVQNASNYTLAKGVVITVQMDDGKDMHIDTADGRCRTGSILYTPFLNRLLVSFECAFINTQDSREFLIKGVPSDIAVNVEYEGYSSKSRFHAVVTGLSEYQKADFIFSSKRTFPNATDQEIRRDAEAQRHLHYEKR